MVGAGLAGLSCAYRLQPARLAAAVYEANRERIGGRCWTAREFAGGQTAEHGGEFIDSRHKRLQGAREADSASGSTISTGSGIRAGRGCGSNGALRHRSRDARAATVDPAAGRGGRPERVGPYGYADATAGRARLRRALGRASGSTTTSPAGARGLLGPAACGPVAMRLRPRRRPAQRHQPVLRVRRGHARRRRALPHARRQRSDPGTRWPRRCPRARSSSTRRWRRCSIAPTAATGCASAASPPRWSPTTSCSRSRSRRCAESTSTDAGLSRDKRACIDELGMGTNAEGADAVRPPPAGLRRLERLRVQRRPVPRRPGRARSGGRGSRASSPRTRRALGRRRADGAGAARATGRARFVRDLDRLGQGGRTGLGGIDGASTGEPRPTTGRRPWARGSYAAYLPGQYSVTTASSANPRARSTSPASTPRPPTRGISRARSSRASGPPGRSFARSGGRSDTAPPSV